MQFRTAETREAEAIRALYQAVIGTPFCTWDPSSTTLLGYRISKKNGIEIDPEQAEIVREIFARLIHGDTLSAIARWLNRNEHFGAFGGKWNAPRVRDLVSNEKYG